MSIDALQEKIRKAKNPSVLMLDAYVSLIPPHFSKKTQSDIAALGGYFRELLQRLKGLIPAVRLGFASFAMLGGDGMTLLRDISIAASEAGYYVLLDMPEVLSQMSAANMAERLDREDCSWYWDGVIIGIYSGSDVLKPFLPLCKKGKSVFPVLRTANKSAPEIQDLLTGSRIVHAAAADIVSRQGETVVGKCGYSQMGALAGASSANSLKTLRAKYPSMFLLLDGYDYPNANAKNCSFAFDKLGHGAAACGGVSIIGAWKQKESEDYLEAAAEAAERMKKNLSRYITVL